MKQISDIHVYSVGLCNLSVCALKDIPIEKITEKVNQEHPTGLSNEWALSKRKQFADGTKMPCPCDTHPKTRRHYLFNC